MLAWFSRTATDWLAGILPRYAQHWQLDRASYQPEEEATRRLRLTARNDLLHVDAFPSRPSQGRRILRLFVNVNLTEPRISDYFRFVSPLARALRQGGRLCRRLTNRTTCGS